MADITYTQFPIEADIVDISQMQTDISNAQTDILNLGQNKADKSTTINGLSLAQNRVLASAQFSEAITGEKMLANILYQSGNSWTGGSSIKLPNDLFLEASEIVGLKGVLTGAADIDSMSTAQTAGMYYLNNVSTTPVTYGLMRIASAYTTPNLAAFQIIFAGANIYFRQNYGSWGSWYKYTGTAV